MMISQNQWDKTSINVRYTLSAIWVADRMNMTIMDIVRCMLKFKGLLQNLG